MEKFIVPNQVYLQFSDCRFSQNDDFGVEDEFRGNSTARINGNGARIFRSSTSGTSELLLFYAAAGGS